MGQITLCMTDIDDTFIDHEKKCPICNVEAVKAMRTKGIRFGIATGRPLSIVPRLFKEWGLEGEVDYVVGSNGAEILNCRTQRKVTQFFLSPIEIRRIVDAFQQFEASICVYEGITLVTNRETIPYQKRCESVKLNQKVVDLSEYIQQPYPKVLIVSSSSEQKRILQHHKQQGYSDFKLVASSSTLLEVIHPSLSKVKGILQVCDELQIQKEQVLCFGDEMNDLEMLSTFVGVCVSNAIEEVKKVCKYQTSSCDEGGVGNFIFEHIV